MKKLLTTLLFFIGLQAHAGLLTVDLDASNIEIGSRLNVDINLSGAQAIDSFSFDLMFDTSLFDYDAGSLVSDLTSSNPFAIYEVNIFDGYMAFTFLDFVQPFFGDVTLASFSLTALTDESTSFNFSSPMFFSGFMPTDIDSTSSASVSINNVSVPETPTIWLFTLTLLSLCYLRKRT